MNMDVNVRKQNTFSRKIYNNAAMGGGNSGDAYTPLQIIEAVRRVLVFPTDDEGNELPFTFADLSCGDASAVTALAGYRCNGDAGDKSAGIPFLNEINAETYDKYLKGYGKQVLNADALNDLSMSHDIISLMGVNPPYGEDGETKKRLEKVFLEKITPYTCRGGVLVWVIPHSTFIDKTYLGYMQGNYDIRYVFRTDEVDWYRHLKPVAIVAVKRMASRLTGDAFEEYRSQYVNYEDLPTLPAENEEYAPVAIPSISIKKFGRILFQKKKFDAEEIRSHLTAIDVLTSKVMADTGAEKLDTEKVPKSLIPLKGDHKVLYLIGSNCPVTQLGDFDIRLNVEQRERAVEMQEKEKSSTVTVRRSAELTGVVLTRQGEWIDLANGDE